MNTPIYDVSTLPCITYPMENKVEQTRKYLGGYAITGRTTATINVMAKSNAEEKALYDFWRTDCNYGLEPFLIPIPLFGDEVISPQAPTLLVKFKSDLKSTKESGRWKSSFEVEVFGLFIYIVDDQGNFVVDDTGEYKVLADGTYVPTGNVINSYRGVIYG